MLRERSIPVVGKPSPSSRHGGGTKSQNLSSPLFLSPHRSLLRSFSAHEAVAMNPTSTKRQPETPPLELQPEPIGLAILDALIDDKENGNLILFKSQLKVRIPSTESPRSPIEFGVKNKESQLALASPGRPLSPAVFDAVSASATELETSENYTCVISRGSNPKTTHIFDDRVLESCGDPEFTALRKNTGAVVQKLAMHCKMRTKQGNKRWHWTRRPRFPPRSSALTQPRMGN